MSNSDDTDILEAVGRKSFEMSLSINLAQRAFNDLLSTCLGHHGLSVPKWTLLGNLHSSGAMRPYAAAELLNSKPSYITRIVTLLEIDGLISMEKVNNHERRKVLTITPAGRKLVEKVELVLKDCINEQLGELDKKELTAYLELNDYIAKNVHHRD